MQSSCLAADVLQLPPLLLLLLIRAASLFLLFVVVVEHPNIRFLLSRVTNCFGSFGDNKKNLETSLSQLTGRALGPVCTPSWDRSS